MFLGIKSIQNLLAKGEITVSELHRCSIERAKQIEHLNAFISRSKTEDFVEYSSHHEKKQPLYGIPFAVKDNYSTKGIRTTCASRMLRNYVPPYNATVVEKLLRSGGNMIGKTNLDEFAMGAGSIESLFGPIKNPWTPGILSDGDMKDWHISGGSSGGSAVAVATGACTFALGSDTGGSVRNPASYCGVVGLKPTYGLISRHGLIPLVNSMDVPGIFARSVEDVAVVLDLLKGQDEFDSTTVDSDWLVVKDSSHKVDVSGLRVGIPKECMVKGLSSEVSDAWKWAADEFENAGACVEEISLPHMRYSIVCYHILCNAEVASNMARYDGLKYGHRSNVNNSTNAMYTVSRKEGLNDTIRSRILAGNYFLLKENREKYYEQAQKVRRLISLDYEKVFDSKGKSQLVQEEESDKRNKSFKCDIILSPVVLTDAPIYSEFITEDNRTRSAEQDILTQSINMAGIPAITVPTCLSKRGLPLGLQIIGNHFSEPTVFKASLFLEQAANFPTLQKSFEDKHPVKTAGTRIENASSQRT